MDRAAHPPYWHSATLPVCAGSVLDSADSLRRLATALQTCEDPPIRGVALAACLINDPAGPLYDPGLSPQISTLARDATEVLTGAPPV